MRPSLLLAPALKVITCPAVSLSTVPWLTSSASIVPDQPWMVWVAALVNGPPRRYDFDVLSSPLPARVTPGVKMSCGQP